MQGIFIKGVRPKSKKQIREAALASPHSVRIEATSMFGNEYGGPATEMPEDATIYFVGPDPYHKRNFYGTITRRASVLTVK
jgi:hypothetical protein